MNFSCRKGRRLRVVFVSLFFVFLFGFLMACEVKAVERSYSYDLIVYDIRVNRDSTATFSERQTYRFVGEYHQGWRNIPKQKFDSFDQISVIDESTGKPLIYSEKRLEKTNPESWGKYTTFFENGEYVIEWYYDARDTTKTWTLKYTIHGAIGFYRDHDELYWNLLTSYSVPVERAEATVTIPAEVDASALFASVYAEPKSIKTSWRKEGGDTFYFLFEDIPPIGKTTIAPGWPKGVVDESAYWKNFVASIWGYIGAGIVIVLTILGLFLRWYFMERYKKGRGTIIPQYEPPRNLRPAMAEVLAKEKLTDKAWVATIIDLAVRGYISIQEEPQKKGMKNMKWASLGIIVIFLFLAISIMDGIHFNGSILFVLFPIIIVLSSLFKNLFPQDYVLIYKQGKNSEVSEKLEKVCIETEAYEKKFLEALFPEGKDTFSTKEMRRDIKLSSQFRKDLQKLRKDVLEETATDTAGYDVDFRVWRVVGPGISIGVIIFVWSFLFFQSWHTQPLVFLSVLTMCGIVFWLFFKYNPRLNREGCILREEWLGFKLYLETAEKYRLQNLMPETFERFLPYAIIFGVEKKWGKAFENISLQNPTWYSGGSIGSSSGVSPSFSAAAFSSSFSSSFSSAFASSGGGGGGGGGGAGGGGGGGGGGAS